MDKHALAVEAGIEERNHYEKMEDDKAIRQSLECAQVFAETIVQSKFSPTERQAFAKIIRQFNTLYWELGIQTWLMTSWRGVPVFKPPTDLWIYQELIYTLKPDLIIETGTCAGGSALFLKDIMNLADINGDVLTIDIEDKRADLVKEHNILFINESSIANHTIEIVRDLSTSYKKIMVILDSDHSYEHVSKELEYYAPLVTIGSALIVEDTNNCPGPKKAVEEWIFDHRHQFKQDMMCEKFMLTFNRDGFYERIA